MARSSNKACRIFLPCLFQKQGPYHACRIPCCRDQDARDEGFSAAMQSIPMQSDAVHIGSRLDNTVWPRQDQKTQPLNLIWEATPHTYKSSLSHVLDVKLVYYLPLSPAKHDKVNTLTSCCHPPNRDQWCIFQQIQL